MSDHVAALTELINDLNRVISNLEGVALKDNIPDKEAILIALDDLFSARALIIQGLVSEAVAH